jgi:hypothetical protein
MKSRRAEKLARDALIFGRAELLRRPIQIHSFV